jgi:hypothetical protein
MPATHPIQPADTPPQGLPLTTSSSHLTALAITDDAPPFALRSTRIIPRTAMRRGASWTADHHLQLTVAAVAGSVLVVLAAELSWLAGRPDGGCPVERPAGIQRSGVVAVVGKARTPSMASVAGPRPACGVHPPGSVVRGPAVQPSSVHPSGVHPSGVHPSSVHPSSVHPSSVHPSSVHPSGGQPAAVRTRPSHPTSGGGVVDQVGAAGNPSPQDGSRSRWASRRGAARSTAGQARTRATLPESRVGQWGSVADPGRVGCGRRPRGCRSWAGVGSTTVGGSRGA